MPDILVSCDSLSRVHGARTLFEGVSFGVFEGERVGLVGPNGSGKSTLLRLIAGLEEPDGGTISRRRLLRLSFVEQSPALAADDTVAQVVRGGLAGLGLEQHETEARAAAALSRAGFEDHEVLVRTLSGGWRKRAAIARELAREPELLLLDEPTNHLDVEGILWLEELLAESRFACLVVTHDRWFLQDVAQRMMELSRAWPGGLFQVRGTYADFLEKREEARAGQEAARDALANVVRREIEWLRRGPKARTTKSQARIQEAGRLQAELAAAEARTAQRTASIEFTSSERRTKRLVVVEGASVSLGGRRVLDGLDLVVTNGSRLGVLGPNGSGKTTLLRLLAGELAPDDGTVTRAPGLAVVRFEQGRESLDPSLSLQRALAPSGDVLSFRGDAVHVSSWARRFLFRSEQLQVPVGRLSGGEQARIILARLMLRPADLLLLDEPTNDLDIPTLEVLEESLVEFPGAVVLVTHDRYVLDRVADSLLSVEIDGRVLAHADLDQWRASRRAVVAPAARPRVAPAEPQSSSRATRKLTWKERQEWEGMEARILAAEAAVEARRTAAEDPSIASSAAVLAARHAALAEARAEVDRLYARWAELESRQS